MQDHVNQEVYKSLFWKISTTEYFIGACQAQISTSIQHKTH